MADYCQYSQSTVLLVSRHGTKCAPDPLFSDKIFTSSTTAKVTGKFPLINVFNTQQAADKLGYPVHYHADSALRHLMQQIS